MTELPTRTSTQTLWTKKKKPYALFFPAMANMFPVWEVFNVSFLSCSACTVHLPQHLIFKALTQTHPGYIHRLQLSGIHWQSTLFSNRGIEVHDVDLPQTGFRDIITTWCESIICSGESKTKGESESLQTGIIMYFTVYTDHWLPGEWFARFVHTF